MARDTLIDFFRDLVAIAATFSSTTTATGVRRHSYADGRRARRADSRRGWPPPASARATRSCSGARTGPSGSPATGAASSPASSSSPSTTASSAEFVAQRVAASSRRAWCSSATTCGCRTPVPTRRSESRRSGLAIRRSRLATRTARCRTLPSPRDDITQIIFTSGATAEPKGVVIRHRNVLANIVPVEREVAEVPQYAQAVSPAAVRQPAAAQPHVRPVDGDQHPADGARHGDLHAQLQPARHRPADQAAARLGARVRAEDSRRAARARRCASIPEPPRRRRPASRIPGALVALSPRAPGARPEVLGVRRRRGAAAARPRGVLAAPGLRRHPGLRPDRDGADRHAQSPVQDEQGIGRHADRRRRGAASPTTARSSCAART